MPQDYYTDLVDEVWLRELVAAWQARDAKLPAPSVRWNESGGNTRAYLSNMPYDWPKEFCKSIVPAVDLPDGSYWYDGLADAVSAMNEISRRPPFSNDQSVCEHTERLFAFCSSFLWMEHPRNDYAANISYAPILLSPRTCSEMIELHGSIELTPLEPILDIALRENAATEPEEECRWHFAGLPPQSLLRDFLAACVDCSRQAVAARRALCVWLG
jgi:hypothetical protein